MIRNYMSSTPSPAVYEFHASTATSGSATYETPLPIAPTETQAYDGYRVSLPESDTTSGAAFAHWCKNLAAGALMAWTSLVHPGSHGTMAVVAAGNNAAHHMGLSGPVAAAVDITVSCTQPRAILPSGQGVAPTGYSGGFHGTSEVPPELALKEGLPRRGNDWRLYEHAVAQSDSAFRGTTNVVYDPVSGQGAAAWAGDSGWVYDVRGVPTWDVNGLLEGRVPRPFGGFTGNLMFGENEHAIPAEIPPEKIKRYGRVIEDHMGRLRIEEWIDNPNFKP